MIVDVELLLEKLSIQQGAYHGGDFNGVCCRKIVGNTPNIFKELSTLLRMKKDESCKDSMINDKLDKLEMISGLLDAAFASLNISYPNEDEKCKASQAVLTLSNYWRMVGLNFTLKAHIMEKHVYLFNNK